MLFLDEHATDDRRAIHSGSLIAHLKWLGFKKISDRTLRVSVIGPIRDAGVIIAGDGKGYRLAMSVSDVERYIRHDRSILEPMLARLAKARTFLMIGTATQYDMLLPEDFTILRELIKTFNIVSVQYSIAESFSTEGEEEDG
jgi:hypothetical protein